MLSIGKFLEALAGRNKSDDPAELSAAIARLEQEKSAAEAEMAAIAARRQKLLLDDRDDELDRDERTAERAYRVVEKVDAALPDIRTRLAAAKSVERRAKWREIDAEFWAEMPKFVGHYAATLKSFEALAEIRGRAQASGFDAEARSMPSLPLVSREMLSLLEAEIARHRAAAVPQPKPAAKPAPTPSKFITGVYSPVDQMFAPKAAPAVATPKAAPSTIASVKPKPAHERIAKPKPAVAPKAAQSPIKPPEADADGNIGIVILRSGYETPAGHRPRMGETVSVPLAAGMRVVESGSAEFAEAAR